MGTVHNVLVALAVSTPLDRRRPAALPSVRVRPAPCRLDLHHPFLSRGATRVPCGLGSRTECCPSRRPDPFLLGGPGTVTRRHVLNPPDHDPSEIRNVTRKRSGTRLRPSQCPCFIPPRFALCIATPAAGVMHPPNYTPTHKAPTSPSRARSVAVRGMSRVPWVNEH